ncbi:MULTISPECIES: hypothetical protein [Pseudomonas]|uniref:hypothetical protein n=1 Tax=Pseudomonas TaxID=286 RepID=UPI001BDE87D2|nr:MULTISPECIES: hypothetical protein [Pseudomonas]MDF9755858.1 hypothetical protein [Pseudomonas hunanensis]QWA30084.1 hypothetical protein KHO27_04105 [Pseudomonas sp. RC3H12]
MNKFLQAVAILLPIKIERVLWDGDKLMLFSLGWSFQTESAWRVSKDGDLLFACWDNDASDLVSGLLNLSVLEVSWLIDDQPIDPCFKLSDGRVLNVFCSSSTEPWVMELSGGAVYVGNT